MNRWAEIFVSSHEPLKKRTLVLDSRMVYSETAMLKTSVLPPHSKRQALGTGHLHRASVKDSVLFFRANNRCTRGV